MNGEEARKALNENEKKREEKISDEIKSEREYWESKNKEDKFYLIRKLVYSILSTFENMTRLEKNVSVSIFVEKVTLSEEYFLNFEEIKEIAKKAGFSCFFEKDHLGAVVETNHIPNASDMRENLELSSDELEQLFESGNKGWLLSIIGGYIKFKKSEKGREDTEIRIAMNFFDEMSRSWNNEVANFPFKRIIEPIRKDISIGIFDPHYADYKKVILYFQTITKNAGFIPDITYNKEKHEIEGFSLFIGEDPKTLPFDQKSGKLKERFLKQ